MRKNIFYLLLVLLLLSCTKNKKVNETYNNNIVNDADLFFNKEINFKKLELGSDISTNERYFITNASVSFIPPINSIKLADEERDNIISKTGYGKGYFDIDSMFIDEKIKITCLAGYTKKEGDNLNSLISFIRKMNNGDNFTEEYYTINGKKNIQFKINMNNATSILYTIFESNNGYYFILNYTFPVSYLEDSLIRIANSLNSVNFSF
ncbi:hypothetical protein [uncultured Brachyspira sp.]|uniref:hypothetical protein n=1 Tax=uncultured Brachyspira sp. TaxID=221953 RepID=UPI0025978A0E|nr:hypothetical protein [uncultured Brachyspira sp.]